MTAPASRLIGRQRDCERLAALVRPGSLVTLTGPGGVGKTRLATEVAAGLDDRTGQPVYIGLLGPLAVGAPADAVAGALGFESVGAATLALAERAGAVVLDNCEHVLSAARDLIAALRDAVPEVTIVATSRQPLGLVGEQVFVVGPLGLPAPGGADAEQAPAVELFLERAASAGAILEPSPRLIADVAALCRRLDGLPLAIELAAARTRALAPGDLLDVVEERLDILARTSRGGDRHDTMRATIEVSTAALPRVERSFFRRLGVFTGPFDLGLAHAVAGEPATDRLASIDLLGVLVDRSLVTAETKGPTTRYRLLELLHDHAREELGRAGELAATEERFVEAMVAVADRIVTDAAGHWDAGPLAAASAQFANLVRACELCLDRDPAAGRAYRLVLPMFAAVHEGRSDEVWQLGARVLARWPDDDARWRAETRAVLATAAAIAGRNGEVGPLAASVVDDPGASPIAAALADRASGLAARTRDHAAAARHFRLAKEAAAGGGAVSMAGELQVFEAGQLDLIGDHDRALAVLDDVLHRAWRDGDVFVAVLAHLVRARVLLRAGDIDAAAVELASAEQRSAAIGHPWWTAAIMRTRAAVTALGPDGWAGSTPRWREAIDVAAGQGAVGEIAITLRTAAAVALHLGEGEVAGVLFASAPRSTAITVLPELFPEATAELERVAPPPPPGRTIGEALAAARAALTAPAAPQPTPEPPIPTPAPAAEAEVGREGDGWRVVFEGRTTRVRDMKGIADIAVLVTRPGKDVHALELMGGQDVGGAAGPLLDDTARRAYQERIVELQRDLDEARANHDPRRADRAEVELDALVEQLREAFGLGGRSRAAGSSAERARTAVTYRIRSAIRRLSDLHPELGRHLANAVRTGTWCSYQPERDVTWIVEDRN